MMVTSSGLTWRLPGADRDAGRAAGGGLAAEAQGHGLDQDIFDRSGLTSKICSNKDPSRTILLDVTVVF